MSLEEIPAGTRIFIDAPIFIYHFTAASASCRDFLGRCEAGELDGSTSSLVLAEVAHRLMTIEAVAKGLVTPGNVVSKLRERPAVVRQLDLYHQQVEKIPLMSIDVVQVDLGMLLRSVEARREHGLLVNDSLVAAAAQELGIRAIASSDPDFDRVTGFDLYLPSDAP